MSKYTFMYDLSLNEDGHINAVLEIPNAKRINGTSGISFEITESDLRRMMHIFEMQHIVREVESK